MSRGCASTTRGAKALVFGREKVTVRVSGGGVNACLLVPSLIFIEHVN
jgi:hypothetical protein